MAADIFVNGDALELLKNKQILFLGDSNIRSMYKDFVGLLSKNVLLTTHQLKGKLESSFMGDKLTKSGKLSNGTNYEEVREYKVESAGTVLRFVFLTRCYNKYIQKLLTDVKEKKTEPPDVVVINSCLWDVSRWGPDSVDSYRQNVPKLMTLFKESLPKETLVIWTTALPISAEAYGGFLIEEVEYLKHTLRYEVMEANIFTSDVVRKSGFNVLDLHYQLRHLMEKRVKDGIHWDAAAVRYITNLILTTIARLWKVELPRNFTSPSLTLQFQDAVEEVKLPEVPDCLTIKEAKDDNVPTKDTDNKPEKKKNCSKDKEDDSALAGNVKTQEQREEPLDWELDLNNIPKVITSHKDRNNTEINIALKFLSCNYFKDIIAFQKKVKESLNSYKPPHWVYENKAREDFSRIVKCAKYYIKYLRCEIQSRSESRHESYPSDFISGIENSHIRFSSPTHLSISSGSNDSGIWSAESCDSSYDADLRRQNALLPTPSPHSEFPRYGYTPGYESPYSSRNANNTSYRSYNSLDTFNSLYPWLLNAQSSHRYLSPFDRFSDHNGTHFGQNYPSQYDAENRYFGQNYPSHHNVLNTQHLSQNYFIQNDTLNLRGVEDLNVVNQNEAFNNSFHEDVTFDDLRALSQRVSDLLQQQMYVRQSINSNERWYEDEMYRNRRDYIERNRRARRPNPY